MTVESCGCDGYFVRADLVQERIATLSLADRVELGHRIRTQRAKGKEVWCTTRDGTVQGPLVLRAERPDRST